MKPSKTEIRIGLYLKHLRQEKNHKQIVLALALNISHSKYSKIENGKMGFTFEFLEKIAAFYNTSVFEMMMFSETNYAAKERLADFTLTWLKVMNSLKNYDKLLDYTEGLMNDASDLLLNKKTERLNTEKFSQKLTPFSKMENDLTQLSNSES